MESWDRFDIFKELCKVADEGNKERVKLMLEMMADCFAESQSNGFEDRGSRMISKTM